MYKATTVTRFENFKQVSTQTEDLNGKHKTQNKYYINDKLVSRYDRFKVESAIDNAPINKTIITFDSNFPTHI